MTSEQPGVGGKKIGTGKKQTPPVKGGYDWQKQTRKGSNKDWQEPSETCETHILVCKACPRRKTCLYVTSHRGKETVFQTRPNLKERERFRKF
jgi:hypothetical protein